MSEEILDENNNNPAEIKMGDIFQSFWAVRRTVLIASALAMMLVVGLFATMRIGIESQQTFQTLIRFAIPAVKNDDDEWIRTYPNGTVFAISDLVAPIVLKKVFDQNNLSNMGIDLGEFSAAVSAQPYSPLYDHVIERYRKRLSNRKLSFVERLNIEKDMIRDLAEMVAQNARISLTLSARVGISDVLGKKLVNDIVAEWAKFSIEQLGVLRLPNLVVGQQPVKVDSLNLMDNLSATYFLMHTTDELKSRINQIGKDLDLAINKDSEIESLTGLATLTDDKTGATLEDVTRNLNFLQDYQLKNLLAKLFLSDKISEPKIALRAFESRLEEKRVKRTIYLTEAAALDNALLSYSSQGISGERGTASANNAQGVQQQGSLIPQISQGFVDRIVTLTKNKAETEFRKKLITSQVEKRNFAGKLDPEISRLELIVKSLKEIVANSGNAQAVGIDAADIKTALTTTAQSLNTNWETMGRLFSKISEKQVSYGGHLFVNLPLSDSVSASVEHPIMNSRSYLLGLGAFFIIVIFSLIGAVMWQLFFRGTSLKA